MVSRCFPGGYNVKLYISRGGLAWWLLAFLHSVTLVTEASHTGLVRQLWSCDFNNLGTQHIDLVIEMVVLSRNRLGPTVFPGSRSPVQKTRLNEIKCKFPCLVQISP